MIVNDLNPKHGRCSLSLESAEDLWTLRRLIAKGDVIVTRSSRVVKHEEEFSRPDKGERVKVTVALEVEEVHLDSSIERIRVRGRIVEASDESVSKSGHHAITLSPGHTLTLTKKQWGNVDTRLLRSTRTTGKRFILVAVDRREAGIGSLTGSHLSLLTTVESGLGGKMWEEQSSKSYFAKVVGVVSQVYNDGDEVVVAGPGNTKSVIANQLSSSLKSASVKIVEGHDVTGLDGIRSLVKAPSFQQLAEGSLLVEMQKMVEEVVRRVSTGDPKVAYTLPRAKEAASAGAVEACAVSDDVFSTGVDEEELVSVLNAVEDKRGRVYLADSSLEFGKQVSAFGGVVALLRYAIRSY